MKKRRAGDSKDARKRSNKGPVAGAAAVVVVAAAAAAASGAADAREPAKRRTMHAEGESDDEPDLLFDDPFGDDVDEDGGEGDHKAAMDEDAEEEEEAAAALAAGTLPPLEDDDDDSDDARETWRPDVHPLGPGEQLEYDSSAYVMYHSLTAEWPCLSFDVVRDNLGAHRTAFPMEACLVAGTQAAGRKRDNKLLVMKLYDLHKTRHDDDSDAEDEEEDLDEDPKLDFRLVSHLGVVNRLRCLPQHPHIVAVWSDTRAGEADGAERRSGAVALWNLGGQIQAVMDPRGAPVPMHTGPLQTYVGHPTEGFALAWSPVRVGRLATGDCSGNIAVWDMHGSAGTQWDVSEMPRVHGGSVEDLQWSPAHEELFVSSSVDRTVKAWDCRARSVVQSVDAHDDDVNVLSWNGLKQTVLVSGADDGSYKVWDTRMWRPMIHSKFHTSPITSVEWDPNDDSVLAVASEDGQITVWDFAVTTGGEAAAGATVGSSAAAAGADAALPQELLFWHFGQQHVKEVHFHPQLPGVVFSTALTGFNVFKPNTERDEELDGGAEEEQEEKKEA